MAQRRPLNLARHPIRYFAEYFVELLREHGEDEALLRGIAFSTRAGIMKVSCRDDLVYQRLAPYKELIDPKYLKRLGQKEVWIHYEVNYAVLKVIREFEKQGITEFTVKQVTDEVNKFPGQRTETRIKGVLWQFCRDLSIRGTIWYYRAGLPEWLLELRGREPVVEKIGQNEFRVVPKPEPKPAPDKKSRKKR